MSSRTCESCLGSGEKPGIGHMPGYKCKKCSGSGIIHNFVVNTPIAETVHNPLGEMSKSEERRLEIQAEAAPRRGRPPKNKD